ncbi:glycoside hydrolase family 66 protein [Vallitalea maricola]
MKGDIMKDLIKDIYPNKAQYLEGETVEIVIEWNPDIKPTDVCISLVVSHLDDKYLSITKAVDNKSGNSIIEIEPLQVNGYGVDISIFDEEKIVATYSTAVDVASSHKDSPRYGFLSDFESEDVLDDEDVLSMKKLHINMVQFYDWMYRHDDLVNEEENYTDLMGKKISLNAIKNKIDLCHKNGMKAIAYGAVYAASKPFYENHKDEALYNSNMQPISFIDKFIIMNIEEKSPWHRHIINEYERAIRVLDFDGIHMDTYGYPKKAVSKLSDDNHIVNLENEFPVLINNTREQLSKVKRDVTLIFNNVGNWPVSTTSVADQDMVYIEVWDPYSTYNHIQSIIRDTRRETDKPIILAAYLKPFMDEGEEAGAYALKILTAAIISNGAYHLILGENQGVLTQGYYVDYTKISDNLFSEIRKYYDFMIRYSDLFYDKSLIDVSMTHAYGDNMEYVFEGDDFSATADSNKIWTIIRESADTKLISLINLKGNDVIWNKGKKQPKMNSAINLKIQVEKEVKDVYISSPEQAAPIKCPYNIVAGERGNILIMDINRLEMWTVIVIKLG